ncbi:MAG: hypothetical protein EOP07_08875 [Proteobacteria bacterium]|nr:MAG: hypothetical protein EOP07_08875 [Pseudomonadota bacterium]
MEFLCKKNIVAFFLFVSVAACSQSKTDEKYIIGTAIDQAGTGGTMQSFEEAGKVYFSSFDSVGRRLNFVDPQTNDLSFSPELGDASHVWLSTKVDGFAFDVKGSSVAVRSNGFQSTIEVLKLAGSITSWASDLPQGYVAFVDEFFSIGLLQIDPSGSVLRQWTGGPIINGLNSVIAGEMAEGGKLLLLVNGGSLLVVDVAATLEAKAWTFQQRDLGLNNPSWIGKVEGRNDRALVYDSVGMHLVDLTLGTVLQDLSIRSYVTPSKNGLDHAFYYDYTTQNIVIVRTNGPDSIQESRFKLSNPNVRQSFLSTDNLVIATDDGSIIKFRLSDGLVAAKYNLKGIGRLGLSEDYVVAMYESALGAIEILNLDNGESKLFNAFNLSSLQN